MERDAEYFTSDKIIDATSRAYTYLEDKLQSPSSDLLEEVRRNWALPAGAPIHVIGRITAIISQTGRETWFLNEIEHPETGVGLLYPSFSNKPGGERTSRIKELDLPSDDDPNRKRANPASAFIPAGLSRKAINPQDAFSGEQWAIAELELAPFFERKKHNNPWLLNVRSGTLKPLSVIPAEWRIKVFSNESVQRIAALAQQEIENHLHECIILENDELARHRAENEIVLTKLKTKIATYRKHHNEAKRDMNDLQKKLEIEQNRVTTRKQTLQEEIQAMELQYRHLKELLLQKADRLIALGLADREDIAAVVPDLADVKDTNPGITLEKGLASDYGRLAPLLQMRLSKNGLLYSQAQIRDFLALLRTRDLVVMAGDSGSGKTSLVNAAAAVIGGVCTTIPVKPNWTGPEDLLGYYNPIERSYQATPFLLALQAAARSPDVPHFICLDEMNLARVEHYFADFLSLLEQRSSSPEIQLYTADEERHVVVEQGLFLEMEAEARKRAGLPDTATLEEILRDDKANIELHRISGLSDNESVLLHHSRLRRSLAAQMRMPTSLTLPTNVWIFGAVNMDETTYQLSPKVLDRVQVLRFQNPMLTDWDAIEKEIETAAEEYPPDIPPLRLTSYELGVRTDYPAFDRHNPNVTFLSQISRQYLDPLGIEFGLRAVRQSLGYLNAARVAGIDTDEALDNVIKHKILPKLAFDTARLTDNGRPRYEILVKFRDSIEQHFEGANLNKGMSSVAELDRMIRLAESNNGIINYWVR